MPKVLMEIVKIFKIQSNIYVCNANERNKHQ
jgi:hypothetical protein